MRYYQDMTHPSWSPESMTATRAGPRRRNVGIVALLLIVVAVLVVVVSRIAIDKEERGNRNQAVGAESPEDPLVGPTATPTTRTNNAASPTQPVSSPSDSMESHSPSATPRSTTTKRSAPVISIAPSDAPTVTPASPMQSAAPSKPLVPSTQSPTATSPASLAPSSLTPTAEPKSNAPPHNSSGSPFTVAQTIQPDSPSPAGAMTAPPRMKPTVETATPPLSTEPPTADFTTISPGTDSPHPPTAPPIPTDSTFRLKMYWQEGYYWQEEDFERKWCLECADCGDPLAYYDADGAYCFEIDAASTCAVGHQLWIRDCNAAGRREDRFAVTSVAGGWLHQIRVESSSLGTIAPRNSYNTSNDTMDNVAQGNATGEDEDDGLSVVSTVAHISHPLCLERIGEKFVSLQHCNETIFEQLWLPISFYGPFALMPADRVDICLTQQHHPKEYEAIGMSDCSQAKTTRFWQTYETVD